MTNTYACKKAIKISKHIIIVTRIQGKTANIIKSIFDVNNPHENPIKIFNKACPDIIFANKRILKLNTRAIYETISIRIKNGAIGKGDPLGKNKSVKDHLIKTTPIKLIPIKCIAAKKKVTTNELVIVNE